MSEDTTQRRAEFKTYTGFGMGVIAGMHVICPECNGQINVHFRKDMDPHWEWDGDEKNPTVIPEIKCGNCQHEFMIDGGFIV